MESISNHVNDAQLAGAPKKVIDVPKAKLTEEEVQMFDYVHKQYPFSNIGGRFKCPDRIIRILRYKPSLRESKKVIRYMNRLDFTDHNQGLEKIDRVNLEKLDALIEDDIDLEPYSRDEVQLLHEQWEEQDVEFKVVKVIADEEIQDDFGFDYDLDKEIELSVPVTISLRDFKRLIL